MNHFEVLHTHHPSFLTGYLKTKMKYSIFFTLFSLMLALHILILESPWKFLLVYPMVNSMIMAFAYSFNKPGFILGKMETGNIHYSLLILNLPWLLLTWTVFFLLSLISKENKADKIGSHNIWIGSYPAFTNLEEYDLVIDLTAEFPRIKAAKAYLCFPNLDGMKLKNIPIERMNKNQIISSKVLIHCAKGRGRSAAFTAILMKLYGMSENCNLALKQIQDCRPKANPSKYQMDQLKEIG